MSLTDNPPTDVSRSNSNSYRTRWAEAWDAFWFASADPMTLGLIRLLTGTIVFYAHLVWTLELNTFFGLEGVLPVQYREMLFGSPFAWSHLGWFTSEGTLLAVHLLGLVIIALFTAGVWTRWTSILTAMLVISYANRATGALFGLDQISGFLCLYLAIGNSGGALSFDAWRAKNKQHDETGQGKTTTFMQPNPWNNLSVRLIQIHMCIVYLFAAIGKLQGETWFTGEAVWLAMASYEYQTVDMTWLAGHMGLVAIMSLTSLAWELAYAALVWPRLTRPIILALAIPVHLGIGICMGMLTFGLIMLVGNLAFIDPAWIRTKLDNIESK